MLNLKKRRLTVSTFLDLEADVRSDNSDEHDDGSLHDFVSGDDSDDQSVTLPLDHDFPYTRSHRHPRDNHWQLAREEHVELSTQAHIMINRERHLPRLTIHPSDCSSNEPPAFRKPMPGDVSLWRVRVKHGFESDCLELVLRQSRRVQNFKIVSAFSQPSIPGTIYVEAPARVDIQRAFRNVHTVFLNEEIMLVPISERVQLLEMRNTDVVAFGHWVRIKKGTYKKDLGFVTDMDSFTSRVRLWVIPRLSYSDTKRTRYTRSDQSLFDPDRARTVFGPDTVQQRIDRFKFQGKVFKHGLLERVLALNDLTTKNVHPTYEELRLFSESLGFDKALKHRWNTDYAAATLCINDRVRVISGEQKGFLGTIVDKHENTVQVQLRKEPDARITFEDEPLLDLLACQVSKSFKVGDYVEVRDGFWAGSRGYVLGICDSMLKVLSDHSWSSYSEDPSPPSLYDFQVHTLNVDFAQADCRISLPEAYVREQSKGCEFEVARGLVRGRDPMAGRHVLVVKAHRYRGYYGIIQDRHAYLETYSVYLEATGKIAQIRGDFLADKYTRLPLSHQPEILASNLKLLSPAVSDSIILSTPAQDSSNSQTPAWDPSSRTPRPPLCLNEMSAFIPELTPRNTASGQDLHLRDAQQGLDAPEYRDETPPQALLSSPAEHWLATEHLRGKSIKVRIVGSRTPDCSWENGTHENKVAYTLGTPVTGDPPAINVKLLSRVPRTMLVPLRLLVPVHPDGVGEIVVIIAGDDVGKVAAVLQAKECEWILTLCGLDLNTTSGRQSPFCKVPRQQLAVCSLKL